MISIAASVPPPISALPPIACSAAPNAATAAMLWIGWAVGPMWPMRMSFPRVSARPAEKVTP
jgi:hypothetical protein